MSRFLLFLTLSFILEQKEFEDYRSVGFSGLGDDYHHRRILEDIPGEYPGVPSIPGGKLLRNVSLGNEGNNK